MCRRSVAIQWTSPKRVGYGCRQSGDVRGWGTLASGNQGRNANGRDGAAGLGGEALERADRLILLELQRDGAISNAALGERVAVSESAAARHRHRLEREGYVKRYAAVVDVERLGFGQAALVEVGLVSQNEEALATFERRVEDVPEVLAVYGVAGPLDYLVHIVARDAHDLERIQHRLTALPGVEHVHTHVVLKNVLNREVIEPP